MTHIQQLHVGGKNLKQGQRVTLEVQGEVLSDGFVRVVSIDVAKKSKMSVQEELLRNIDERTKQMQAEMPRTEVTG